MVYTALILSPSSSFAPSIPAYTQRRSLRFSIRCCEDTLGRSKLRNIVYDSIGLESFPEKNYQPVVPTLALPPRPRRIILVRHGQSEGNIDESVYTRTPDPKIGLTEIGVIEAYKRTLETLRGVGKAFESSRIAGVREEPRLREQDFGRLQSMKHRIPEICNLIPIFRCNGKNSAFHLEQFQLTFTPGNSIEGNYPDSVLH